MKNEVELRNCMRPFLEMVRVVKSSTNPEKDKVIEDFKNKLIELDICFAKSNPLLFDKIFDGVIED